MTTSRIADVCIVGLGAMGGATASELARRGLRVVGIDRWRPPHVLGSSHGQTRIIREAYFEHPAYVPLVRRAYERWDALERSTGRTLFHRTGGIMIGPADGTLVAGALASARSHGIAHELLEGREVRRRFPALHADDAWVGVLEQRAGVLFVESCIEAQLEQAARHGATLRFDEPVLDWHVADGHVVVHTGGGTIEAGSLVLAAGPWLPSLLPELALPLTVERQVSHWIAPSRVHEASDPARCPIAIWEYERGHYFFEQPDFGLGLKVGVHHDGPPADPETVDRVVAPEEREKAAVLSRRLLPALEAELVRSAVCLYTNTPDTHFIIDRHPVHDRVVVLSPCSGHGFKFASAIGEVAADLAMERTPGFDLSLFSLRRFANPLR
jgi:sarcosine oxidase